MNMDDEAQRSPVTVAEEASVKPPPPPIEKVSFRPKPLASASAASQRVARPANSFEAAAAAEAAAQQRRAREAHYGRMTGIATSVPHYPAASGGRSRVSSSSSSSAGSRSRSRSGSRDSQRQLHSSSGVDSQAAARASVVALTVQAKGSLIDLETGVRLYLWTDAVCAALQAATGCLVQRQSIEGQHMHDFTALFIQAQNKQAVNEVCAEITQIEAHGYSTAVPASKVRSAAGSGGSGANGSSAASNHANHNNSSSSSQYNNANAGSNGVAGSSSSGLLNGGSAGGGRDDRDRSHSRGRGAGDTAAGAAHSRPSQRRRSRSSGSRSSRSSRDSRSRSRDRGGRSRSSSSSSYSSRGSRRRRQRSRSSSRNSRVGRGTAAAGAAAAAAARRDSRSRSRSSSRSRRPAQSSLAVALGRQQQQQPAAAAAAAAAASPQQQQQQQPYQYNPALYMPPDEFEPDTYGMTWKAVLECGWGLRGEMKKELCNKCQVFLLQPFGIQHGNLGPIFIIGERQRVRAAMQVVQLVQERRPNSADMPWLLATIDAAKDQVGEFRIQLPPRDAPPPSPDYRKKFFVAAVVALALRTHLRWTIYYVGVITGITETSISEEVVQRNGREASVIEIHGSDRSIELAVALYSMLGDCYADVMRWEKAHAGPGTQGTVAQQQADMQQQQQHYHHQQQQQQLEGTRAHALAHLPAAGGQRSHL
jgi:hypothetical protein